MISPSTKHMFANSWACPHKSIDSSTWSENFPLVIIFSITTLSMSVDIISASGNWIVWKGLFCYFFDSIWTQHCSHNRFACRQTLRLYLAFSTIWCFVWRWRLSLLGTIAWLESFFPLTKHIGSAAEGSQREKRRASQEPHHNGSLKVLPLR